MAIDFEFRERAVRSLTTQTGVYVLCDLDKVPIYVGKSRDGIRSRVRRHLTSARSDIIANRQIDVWEVAWVLAYPIDDISEMARLEAALFHEFDPASALMNGQMPPRPDPSVAIPSPLQTVQVMADQEIGEKLDPALRLPRQAGRYAELVEHFLAVKNSSQVARAMQAHFARLHRYHVTLLGLATQDTETEE
jgi:2-polyprenyl-6-methoxyphenol hydroxylase-like FAD-dependent oxidoreductase